MIESLYTYFLQSSGVSTDTRNIQPGQIFFALNGPNFNANKFAEKALEKGALLAVVDDQEYVKGDACFLVEDGLKALQQLANHHRRQLNIPVIGITGSNGKTTTKELMRDVLAKKFKVNATKGNLNNHIGVPLTLLSISSDTEIAIVEMGANHVGEIAVLCEIAEPTHGLITNIGRAHLEGFGGIEGVFKGKTELYSHLASRNGVLFVNIGNDRLLKKAKDSVEEVVTFGPNGDDLNARLVEESPKMLIEVFGKRFTPGITGAYNFENICSALCIGKYFGVSNDDAISAVANYVPDNNRSQVIEKKGIRIILDAYNANPSSMKAALQNLAGEPTTRKYAILGDMYELGEEGPEAHKELGALTNALSLDQVWLVGELMSYAKETNENALYFKSKEELEQHLLNHSIDEGTVLIKGSRGIGLETILERL